MYNLVICFDFVWRWAGLLVYLKQICRARDLLFSLLAQWLVTGVILLAKTNFSFTRGGKQILPFVAFVTGTCRSESFVSFLGVSTYCVN